jgi:hypothetical protein
MGMNLSLCSDDNGTANLAKRSRDLSLKYIAIYRETGQLAALNGAVRNARNAVEDSSESPDSESLAHLGTWLRYKFDRTGLEEHISEGSIWSEQAVLCAAEKEEEGPEALIINHVVNTLLHFQATGDTDRVKEAMVSLKDLTTK